jgi:hypothetical protein
MWEVETAPLLVNE